MSAGRRPFGVYDSQSRVLYLGMHEDEDAVWQTFLGWPSEKEIRAAKLRGLHVKVVSVNYEDRQ